MSEEIKQLNKDLKILSGFTKQLPGALIELTGEVRGMNKRLDTINGRLNNHDDTLFNLNKLPSSKEIEERFDVIEKQQAEDKGQAKSTAKVVGWVSGIASTLVVSAVLYAIGLKK